MTLAELNQALQSPKSSLLNLLRPLVIDGFLACDNGRYRLGPSIFRLAANIMSVWNFSSTMRPYLEELAMRSEESVYIGVLETVGSVITYVDSIESPKAVRFSVPIGAARPLYSTAAGRVLLAFGDQEWVENYLRNTKFMAYTPHTISSRKALREELENIRRTRHLRQPGRDFPRVGRDRGADFRRRRQAHRGDRDRCAGQPARAATRRAAPDHRATSRAARRVRRAACCARRSGGAAPRRSGRLSRQVDG